MALGWPRESIIIIDEDQGRSAAETGRRGFQRLVAEVGMGHAGIIMSLEASRLARNSSDWHRLLEICAVTATLLLDEEGVYDPAHFDDRLLLGLKGTLSEVELHMIRARLIGGLLNKARRGELRMHHGPCKGELFWGPLTLSRANYILHNPRYAGAYVYRRRRHRCGVDGRTIVEWLPQDEWHTLIKEAHEGYISWEEFEESHWYIPGFLRSDHAILRKLASDLIIDLQIFWAKKDLEVAYAAENDADVKKAMERALEFLNSAR